MAGSRAQQRRGEPLRYELDASLVLKLTWAHRNAGKVACVRLTHYTLKRLEADASRRRIAAMVEHAGHPDVTLDEVGRVLAGDVLAPERRAMMELIMRATVLGEAVRQLGKVGNPSTAETFASYRAFLGHGSPLWPRFVGERRDKLLASPPRAVAEAPAAVKDLYDAIEADPLVLTEPLLRAATLLRGLLAIYPAPADRPAIEAIVAHELRAGGIDAHGLLVLPQSLAHERAHTKRDGGNGDASNGKGRLTSYYVHFTIEVARALEELYYALVPHQEREKRLAWATVRPPDELDRQIFETIERLGSARSGQIMEELREAPALRTLQRRLRRMCEHGLVIKHGARKDAFYQIAEQA